MNVGCKSASNDVLYCANRSQDASFQENEKFHKIKGSKNKAKIKNANYLSLIYSIPRHH